MVKKTDFLYENKLALICLGVIFFLCNTYSCGHDQDVNKGVRDSLSISNVFAEDKSSILGDSSLVSKKDTLFHCFKENLLENITDSFFLFKMRDTFYFGISGKLLNLHSDGLNAIHYEDNDDRPFLIFDNKVKKNRYVAFLVPDSLFTNQSFLKIFQIRKDSIVPISFCYENDKFYYSLIAKNDFSFINTEESNIFCETFTKSDTVVGLKYNIDKYIFDSITGKIVLKGSKFFTDKIFKNPNSVQF